MIIQTSPISQRQHVRHDAPVSKSERERIKEEAIRKIHMRQVEAVKRRQA